MLAKSLVMCFTFVTVTCQKGRDGKFFSFNFEDRDITVDLDFSIPFITIPIKKSDPFGVSELPTININPVSLVLGGAVVVGTTIILPIIMKHFIANSNYRYSRILENPEFSTDAVIKFANEMMSDTSSFRTCALRVACWTGKKEDEGLTRAVQRFTTNKLISNFINVTAVEDAMLSGRSGRDCSTYQPCPVKEDYFPKLLDNLSILRQYGVDKLINKCSL